MMVIGVCNFNIKLNEKLIFLNFKIWFFANFNQLHTFSFWLKKFCVNNLDDEVHGVPDELLVGGGDAGEVLLEGRLPHLPTDVLIVPRISKVWMEAPYIPGT